jgi:hypothetical protein
MALILKADPTQLEAAAGRAEAALEGVKREAVATESAIDRLGREAGRDLAPVAAGAQRVTQSANDMARAAGNAGAGSRTMGFQVQNAAFQIGDMATQIAGGTSAFRAMAQQLPQLLGGFGVLGAVIGGLVAVGAAVAPMFFNTASAADTLADAQGRLSDSIATLRDISAELRNLDALKAKYGEVDAALLTLIGHQRDQAIAAAQSAARDAINAFAGEYGQLLADIALQSKAGLQAVTQLKNELGLSARQGRELREAVAAAQSAEDFQSQAEALARVDAILAQSKISAGEFSKAVTAAALELRATEAAVNASGAALVGAEQNAAGLATQLQNIGAWALEAKNEAVALSQVDLNPTIAAAASSAADLARNLGVSLGIAQRMMRAGYSQEEVVLDPRDPRYDAGAAQRANNFGFKYNTSASVPNVSGGGSAAEVDDTRAAYDRLLASLSPVVEETQEMAKATEIVNEAFAAGEISAVEQANALDMIREKYAQTTDAMQALKDSGANALDGLINGTMSLSEALKQMARDLIFATIKAQLLNSVTGATSSMSLGGIIMQGLFSGFHDAGGTIPAGSFGVVGERGPELVRATAGGAMVTSRVDTARMMQSSQNVHVTVSVDDDGKIKAMVSRAGRASAASAVDAVKRNLAGWNSMLAIDGALA